MEKEQKARIVFVVNADWFFLSHRLPLALEAIQRGFEVYLLTKDTGKRPEIESYGINFIEIPFDRSGTNIFHELKCLSLLRRHYRELKPALIHQVTLKTTILGSLAAKTIGFKNVVNAISGLGYNFTDGRNGLLQIVIRYIIKVAFLSKSFYFIFQNPDDICLFKRLISLPDDRIHLIKGSGVDLSEFSYTSPKDNDKLRFLFPARILYDKGVIELLKAAHELKSTMEQKIIFILAGDCDSNNRAVMPESELKKHLISGYIEWIGFRKDMIEQYRMSDIVVLPSYQEGLPKSLIEACAIGRPIISTDVPGCRECVIDRYNGYLVPAKQVEPIKEAIMKLYENKELRITMGKNGRLLAEKEFSIDKVVEKTFSIYEELQAGTI